MNIEELKQRALQGDVEATHYYARYIVLVKVMINSMSLLNFCNMLQSKVMRKLHAYLQICTLQVGDKATHMK